MRGNLPSHLDLEGFAPMEVVRVVLLALVGVGVLVGSISSSGQDSAGNKKKAGDTSHPCPCIFMYGNTSMNTRVIIESLPHPLLVLNYPLPSYIRATPGRPLSAAG